MYEVHYYAFYSLTTCRIVIKIGGDFKYAGHKFRNFLENCCQFMTNQKTCDGGNLMNCKVLQMGHTHELYFGQNEFNSTIETKSLAPLLKP